MAQRDRDTEWLRVQIYRRMTPQQRILIAAQAFEDGVAIVRASILDHRPDITPEELNYQVRCRVLGRELAHLARKQASGGPRSQ